MHFYSSALSWQLSIIMYECCNASKSKKQLKVFMIKRKKYLKILSPEYENVCHDVPEEKCYTVHEDVCSTVQVSLSIHSGSTYLQNSCKAYAQGFWFWSNDFRSVPAPLYLTPSVALSRNNIVRCLHHHHHDQHHHQQQHPHHYYFHYFHHHRLQPAQEEQCTTVNEHVCHTHQWVNDDNDHDDEDDHDDEEENEEDEED